MPDLTTPPEPWADVPNTRLIVLLQLLRSRDRVLLLLAAQCGMGLVGGGWPASICALNRVVFALHTGPRAHAGFARARPLSACQSCRRAPVAGRDPVRFSFPNRHSREQSSPRDGQCSSSGGGSRARGSR